MSYMRDSTGKRLDEFEVADLALIEPEITKAQFKGDRIPMLRGVPGVVGCRAIGLSAAQATAQTVQVTTKWSAVVGFDGCDIRLVYMNARNNQYNEGTTPYEDVIPEQPMTLRAGIDVGGVRYALYVNGKRDFIVDAGGWVETDPLPLEVLAGDVIRGITYQAAGNWRVWGAIAGPVFGGDGAGITTVGDFTGEGATALSDGGGSGIVPAAITITPKNKRQRTIALVGASDMEGVGDGYLQNAFNMAITNRRDGSWGWANRWARGKTGVIQVARTGDRVSKFILPTGHKRREMFISSCSDVITTNGLNDILLSDTQANIKQNKIAEWIIHRRRGCRVWQTTWTPISTSSDNWTTLAGQTVGINDANRVAVNNWFRDGAPINYPAYTHAATGAVGAGIIRMGHEDHPLHDVIDLADTVESARDSGKWAVNNVEAITGSMTAGSNVLTLDRPWVASDKWGLLQIPAGAAGIQIRGYVGAITGANTATLLTTSGAVVNAAITVNNVAVKHKLPTVDGLHGTNDSHERMEAGVAAKMAEVLLD